MQLRVLHNNSNHLPAPPLLLCLTAQLGSNKICQSQAHRLPQLSLVSDQSCYHRPGAKLPQHLRAPQLNNKCWKWATICFHQLMNELRLRNQVPSPFFSLSNSQIKVPKLNLGKKIPWPIGESNLDFLRYVHFFL